MMFFGKSSALTSPPPPPIAEPVTSSSNSGPAIDATTILSLLGVLVVLSSAYALSVRLLPKEATLKTRVLFVWHAFDALIHFIFEGSYLWNCFFVYEELEWSKKGNLVSQLVGATRQGTSDFLPPNIYFLNHKDRLYGAFYGAGPFSKLWQEYAKADRRWGGADLTVISLELLTVLIMGPLALSIAWMLTVPDGVKGGSKKWFWMTVLAACELYGGFMTFAPEWLSGNVNLDTSNWLYLWVYLFFFNTLWVWIPLWILWESYRAITSAMSHKEVLNVVEYMQKKGD